MTTATRFTAPPSTAALSEQADDPLQRGAQDERRAARISMDLLESGLVDYIISTSPHGRDPHA